MTKDQEEHFDDWLRDQRADDPLGFETKAGEGWTRETWLEKFREEHELTPGN